MFIFTLCLSFILQLHTKMDFLGFSSFSDKTTKQTPLLTFVRHGFETWNQTSKITLNI